MKDLNYKKPAQAAKSSTGSDPHIPGTEGMLDTPAAIDLTSPPAQDQQILEALRQAMVVDGAVQEGRVVIHPRGDRQVEIMKAVSNQPPASFGVFHLV